jgi:SPASM domain peptide maturase of grasp-with-spasm system
LIEFNKYFKLFANCVPVKGALRSTICDINLNEFHLIPNDLFDLLVQERKLTIGELFHLYGIENEAILTQYFHFLFSNSLIFYCDKDEYDLFPPLNLEFDSPSIINSAIIDIDSNSLLDFASIAGQLKSLGCEYLEIRSFFDLTKDKLFQILSCFDDSNISGIHLVLKFSDELTHDAFNHVLQDYLVYYIHIHSTPAALLDDRRNLLPNDNIHYMENVIEDETHCGVVNVAHFNVNISMFSESQKFNTCLNKKISIDRFGNIKNCPSLSKSYGNINNQSLTLTAQNPDFIRMFLINKDQINICQDCEFRHICTDCRAYTENNDLFGKPAKCNYNPYAAEWAD